MALSASVKAHYQFFETPTDMILPMPLKAGAVVYQNAVLEFNGGFVEPVSGAGVFAGFAVEGGNNTGGADGAIVIQVRVTGMVDLPITTETPAQSHIGVANTVVEATDDNTFRIETASAITGTVIGKPVAVVPGNKMRVSFKAQHVA